MGLKVTEREAFASTHEDRLALGPVRRISFIAHGRWLKVNDVRDSGFLTHEV